MDSLSSILEAFTKVSKREVKNVTVKEYKFDSKTQDEHQFVFFVKPEALADYDGVKVEQVLKLILSSLADAKVNIGAISVLGGEHLAETGIMRQHYGVISSLSAFGLKVITEAAKAKLNEVFEKEIKAGAEILGAHELLEKEKELNAFALRVLNDNLGTTRLGGGTYAHKLTVSGKVYIVINPFHPYQLVPYTTPGHAIIVMEGRSAVPWAELRNKVCGVTEPAAAAVGSIRRTLKDNQGELGMKDVNKSNNGCHMSAGPLEAMVELQRFFSLASADTAFGSLLGSKGVSKELLEKFAKNENFTFGEASSSAFDATEEVDAAAAADKLLAAK